MPPIPAKTRNPDFTKVKPIKARIHAAGATLGDVARLAKVSYRFVQMVIDGDRRSETVMAAIDRLAPR